MIKFIKLNANLDALIRFFVVLFVCLIEFRIFNNKGLSLADPIFLIIALSFLFNKSFSFTEMRPHRNILLLAIFALTWIFSHIAPIFSYPSTEWLDFLSNNIQIIVGSVYLVVISLVFRYVTIKYGVNFVLKAIIYAGLTNATLGFFGLALLLFGIESELVCLASSCTSSPYVEDIPRMIGFSLSPNGYAYSQFTALIATLALFFRGGVVTNFSLLSLFVIAMSLLLSFSQLLVLGVLVLFIWFSNKFITKAYKKIALLIVLISGCIMYVLITHFMLTGDQDNCIFGNEIAKYEFIESNIQVCPSFFVQQKKIYVDIGIKNIPWGIGARNEFIDNKLDPHSMYLERFSLHGWMGVISFILFALIIYKVLNNRAELKQQDYIYFALALFWVMQLYIGINADIFRYRELCIMLGITIGIGEGNNDKQNI